ncbi:MAG: hypothetical protein OXH56_01900 [Gemmatimonadetes bacterium]|nr:hypothetical protein [Gemmatimonadota bacterium]
MKRLITSALFLFLAAPAEGQTQTSIAGVLQSTAESDYASATLQHESEWPVWNGVLEAHADVVLGIDFNDRDSGRTDRLDLEIITNCDAYFFGAETRTQLGDLTDPRITRGKLGSGVTFGDLQLRTAAAVELNRDETDPEPGIEISAAYDLDLPGDAALTVRVNGFAGRGDYRTVTAKNRLTLFNSTGLQLAVDHYVYHRNQHAPDNEVLLSLGYSF